MIKKKLVMVVASVWVITFMLLEFMVGLLVFLPFLGMVKLYTRWSIGKTVRFFIWYYGKVWLIIVYPFVKVWRENMRLENFPRPGIIVLNHLSLFDAYFMGALPLFDARFTVRAWPFRLWWYAPFMRLAGYMNEEELSWDELELHVREIAQEGQYAIFFPEGHRSRDGALGRFHSGAFKLSCMTGMPIIPLCIAGTDQLLPPGHVLLKPAKVHMRCLAPVYPEEYTGELGHLAMRKKVRASMLAALNEMRREL